MYSQLALTRITRTRSEFSVGTSTDVNVPYIHSVKLVDELLKKRKTVEFMMYPGEFHYFQREYVPRDAWRRVESFFDTHLRAPSTTATAPRE
ncbi:MAG TPA: prolyl oligopeptidase family serine peptidase [Vicinamibacterales bacterium]|nr:prolyl oligopeptidase family serine peptidase [Vicinamibacterales bacterium]